MVAGDPQVLRYHSKRLFADDNRLKFIGQSELGADYLLLLPQFRSRLASTRAKEIAAGNPVFEFKKKGVSLLNVYRANVLTFSSDEPPFVVRAEETLRLVGRLIDADYPEKGLANFPNLKRVLTASPLRETRGYVLTGEQLRFPAATYAARFFLALPKNEKVPPGLGPERYALRLDFGRCEKIVRLGELSAEEYRPFEVVCDFKSDLRAQLRAYWFGNVPISFAGMQVQRLGS
jgi:hypothetical protein